MYPTLASRRIDRVPKLNETRGEIKIARKKPEVEVDV